MSDRNQPLLPSFGVGGTRSAARRHGEVLLRARRSGQEGPGDVQSSLRRAPVGEAARRRARARRRTICSPARCSACRRGRRHGGLQVRNLASWRCVPRCVTAWAKARWPESPAGPQPCLPRRVSAWAKAWWPVALSTSGGLGLLGSSVAFGSSYGEALPGVPRKAPLCLLAALP